MDLAKIFAHIVVLIVVFVLIVIYIITKKKKIIIVITLVLGMFALLFYGVDTKNALLDALHLLDKEICEEQKNGLIILEEIGSGSFGVVHRGKLGSIDVAVKTANVDTMSEKDFINEGKVMANFDHPNILKLLDVYDSKPIRIITEYMSNGSLLNYIQDNKEQLSCAALCNMSIQVAKGMTYLESHNYIHRDLAARNCLLSSENVVKVADFGLTRLIHYNQYISTSTFPVKWSPPEVLTSRKFSNKSDVWSYGVLLWEIHTGGEEPYDGLTNDEICEYLLNNKILNQPNGCPDYIYQIMKQCWTLIPENRPTFTVLQEQLLEYGI